MASLRVFIEGFCLRDHIFHQKNKLSLLPGIFMLAEGISEFGIGFYPSPQALLNVFGLSMTLDYFSLL